MHRAKAIAEEISRNLVYSLQKIDEQQIEKLIQEILRANKIF